jgi:hypothetical protein
VDFANGSLFQFKGESATDEFIVRDNEFIMSGDKTNSKTGFVRNSALYLQGYSNCVIKNNTFRCVGEAAGLVFATVNFDCRKTDISDNTMIDLYRINFRKADHPTAGSINAVCGSFNYTGNQKSYTSSYKEYKNEISLADADISNLVVEVPHSNNSNEFIMLVEDGVKVNSLDAGEIKGSNNKLLFIRNQSKSKIVKVKSAKKVSKQTSGWYLN